MNTLLLAFLMGLCALGLLACGGRNVQGETLTERSITQAHNDVVIVFFDATVGDAALREAVAKEGATVVYDYRQLNGMAVRVPQGRELYPFMERLRAVPGVLAVQENEVHTLHSAGMNVVQ